MISFVISGGRTVFTQFRVFPISTNVDITVYQYGKTFYVIYQQRERVFHWDIQTRENNV